MPEDGIDKLYLLDTETWEYEQIHGVPAGQIRSLNFHPDGEKLAFVISTPQTPTDTYVLHLKDHSTVRWVCGEIGKLDAEAFVVPELIRGIFPGRGKDRIRR